MFHETSDDASLVPVPGASFQRFRTPVIDPNTKQPREVFNEEDLTELSASPRKPGSPAGGRPEPATGRSTLKGVRSPVAARYELIRRGREAPGPELAGETTIPAIIRETEDGDPLPDAC